jgi:hypothetical protein
MTRLDYHGIQPVRFPPHYSVKKSALLQVGLESGFNAFFVDCRIVLPDNDQEEVRK